MPTYMGNAGHLMQHWTLCELLDIAKKNETPGLSFIDAHAMAPLADVRTRANATFNRARVCPPDERSVYQRAWHHLAPISGYPNSAAFVNQIWTGDFSMSLCEIDDDTIAELNAWLPDVEGQPRCKRARVFHGDWRDRFKGGLPSPPAVGLRKESLTVVSFDPYICSWHREVRLLRGVNDGNLYPEDVERAANAMNNLTGEILMQLSTYSSQNNSQGAVISSVNSILVAKEFTLCAAVRVDGSMMSLVYARNVPWAAELAGLPQRFTDWIHGI